MRRTAGVTLCLLLVSLVAPAEGTLRAQPGEDSRVSFAWLATGDSYSSGEGIDDAEGECQHSDRAYGPLAERRVEGEEGWAVSPFVLTACTGDTLVGNQYNEAATDAVGETTESPGGRSLWDWAREEGLSDEDPIGLITMTFGGNDIDFRGALEDCWGLDDTWIFDLRRCDVSREELLERVEALTRSDDPSTEENEGRLLIDDRGTPEPDDDLRGSLGDFYAYVHDRHLEGRGGHLVVVGYPRLFAHPDTWRWWYGDRCSGIHADDARMLNEVAMELDETMREQVEEAAEGRRIHYLSTVGRFSGHGLCSDEEWITSVWDSRKGASIRFEQSFHPNAAGHEAMAAWFRDVLVDLDWSGFRNGLGEALPDLVTYVEDGDTACIRLSEPPEGAGSAEDDCDDPSRTPDVAGDYLVRLIGVDTQEITGPAPECFGEAAERWTRDRLEGRRVKVEYDPAEETVPPPDGRVLAYLWAPSEDSDDLELFNEALVREGYAIEKHWFRSREGDTPTEMYRSRLLEAEAEARAAGRRYWDRCAEADVEVRPASGPAGTTFVASGRGYTPNATAVAHLARPDGTKVEPTVLDTDTSGSFVHEIESAGLEPGTYEYWVIDERHETNPQGRGIVNDVVTFTVTSGSDRPRPPTPVPTSGDGTTARQLWVARYDDPGLDRDSPSDIAVAPGGSRLFVTGRASGSETSEDYATIAYDSDDGAQLWVARFDGSQNRSDRAEGIAVAPDGSRVFVTGSSYDPDSRDDYATVAYDARDGRELWATRYQGPALDGLSTDRARAISVSPDGSRVFVTGASGSATTPESVTVAYDAADGTELWVARYDYDDADHPAAVAVSPDGSLVFVTGTSWDDDANNDYATVAYDAADGTQVWSARYNGPIDGRDEPRAIDMSPDGSRVFVTGGSRRAGTYEPHDDYATVAYDAASGEELWAARDDGPAEHTDVAHDVVVDAGGSRVLVTGESRGSNTHYDYATIAYDMADGAQAWVARYNHDDSQDRAQGIAVAPDGSRAVVTGLSMGSETGSDYGTVVYDPRNGEGSGVVRYNGPSNGSDRAEAIALSADGSRAFVTGLSGSDYVTVAVRVGRR